MMHDMNGWTFWGHGIGRIFWWIIIIAVTVLAIALLTKQISGTRGKSESPIDIAKKRYAKGEITKEEFEKIKKNLS